MTQTKAPPTVKDIVKKLGRCLELVSMDPHFHDVTVGLYYRGNHVTSLVVQQGPGDRRPS